ncbi:MAG: NAD-binding protein [Clostridia bacterium]
MRVVIAGGGKVGLHLSLAMIEKRHSVSLIENNRNKCINLANDLNVQVIYGDCTNVSVLETANIRDVDCFIAVTGCDQDNIVAAQMAKEYFGAKKVIARTNDPRNIKTFRLLGIDYTVSSTEIITKLIEQEADLSNMHLLASINKGKGAICTMTLPHDTAHDGLQIKDIVFPKGALVISVVRKEKLIIPNGYTTLQEGDEVVAVCEDKSQKALTRLLAERK